MTDELKVSIITPSYNQGKFIEETINSVLAQSYTNVEYIIVDGCSTDSTLSVLDKYRERIQKIIIEEDKGQADAINKGFRIATGTLVGWLNSDDLLHRDCIKRVVECYTNCGTIKPSIIYPSRITFINKESKEIASTLHRIPNRHFLVHTSSVVIQPGSFYRNDLLKNIQYLNEDLHYCMDLDLWLRLSKHSEIKCIDGSALSYFRTYETNKSTTGKFKYSKERRNVLFKEGASLLSPTILKSFLDDLKMLLKPLFSKA